MAVVKGTNAGFVTVAPTTDPSGSGGTMDNTAVANKDTTAVGVGTIIEVGWYCDNATEAANFEIGLYSHDAGDDKPNALLFSSTVNAKGTGSGWKTVAVNWSVSAETIYWIALQLDDTATATSTNNSASTGGYRYSIKFGQTTLTNPWGASTDQDNYVYSIYALVKTPTYSELAGTIAAESTISGNMDTITTSTLAGTIAATSSVSGNLGSTIVNIEVETSFIKRLIVVGNNQIQYEDI